MANETKGTPLDETQLKTVREDAVIAAERGLALPDWMWLPGTTVVLDLLASIDRLKRPEKAVTSLYSIVCHLARVGGDAPDEVLSGARERADDIMRLLGMVDDARA